MEGNAPDPRGLDMYERVLGRPFAGRLDGVREHTINHLFAEIWSRPQLPLKIRSLVTLGMLAALNRPDETKGHIGGALNNGATPEEIVEVFVQAAAYCGFPASNGCVRLSVEVFRERGLI